ncbi:WD40-repeat-containing domain [Pseudocohnilembus persalinus]|uniref:WD40-repeat-containing domain n=1 Tax=Pseudocohnilembus persalinus TaxID=266149 RepID=A0A0V0R1P0_PSEPJ|nr:WD40-repeat-containing domain [Pseudocohnilembus persalinus]|eukprot:KRX08444.1 WD40-repeat-containing domain [Pseudocohnilembus persalinus]
MGKLERLLFKFHFFLILQLYLFQKCQAQNCQFCSSCTENVCDLGSCDTDFFNTNLEQKCVSICDKNQYYNQAAATPGCYQYCDTNQIQKDENKGCLQINECPQFTEYGQLNIDGDIRFVFNDFSNNKYSVISGSHVQIYQHDNHELLFFTPQINEANFIYSKLENNKIFLFSDRCDQIVWDYSTGENLISYKFLQDKNCTFYDENSQHLYGYSGMSFYAININSKQITQYINDQEVTQIIAYNDYIFTSDIQNFVKIWSLSDNTTFPGYINSVAYSYNIKQMQIMEISSQIFVVVQLDYLQIPAGGPTIYFGNNSTKSSLQVAQLSKNIEEIVIESSQSRITIYSSYEIVLYSYTSPISFTLINSFSKNIGRYIISNGHAFLVYANQIQEYDVSGNPNFNLSPINTYKLGQLTVNGIIFDNSASQRVLVYGDDLTIYDYSNQEVIQKIQNFPIQGSSYLDANVTYILYNQVIELSYKSNSWQYLYQGPLHFFTVNISDKVYLWDISSLASPVYQYTFTSSEKPVSTVFFDEISQNMIIIGSQTGISNLFIQSGNALILSKTYSYQNSPIGKPAVNKVLFDSVNSRVTTFHADGITLFWNYVTPAAEKSITFMKAANLVLKLPNEDIFFTTVDFKDYSQLFQWDWEERIFISITNFDKLITYITYLQEFNKLVLGFSDGSVGYQLFEKKISSSQAGFGSLNGFELINEKQVILAYSSILYKYDYVYKDLVLQYDTYHTSIITGVKFALNVGGNDYAVTYTQEDSNNFAIWNLDGSSKIGDQSAHHKSIIQQIIILDKISPATVISCQANGLIVITKLSDGSNINNIPTHMSSVKQIGYFNDILISYDSSQKMIFHNYNDYTNVDTIFQQNTISSIQGFIIDEDQGYLFVYAYKIFIYDMNGEPILMNTLTSGLNSVNPIQNVQIRGDYIIINNNEGIMIKDRYNFQDLLNEQINPEDINVQQVLVSLEKQYIITYSQSPNLEEIYIYDFNGNLSGENETNNILGAKLDEITNTLITYDIDQLKYWKYEVYIRPNSITIPRKYNIPYDILSTNLYYSDILGSIVNFDNTDYTVKFLKTVNYKPNYLFQINGYIVLDQQQDIVVFSPDFLTSVSLTTQYPQQMFSNQNDSAYFFFINRQNLIFAYTISAGPNFSLIATNNLHALFQVKSCLQNINFNHLICFDYQGNLSVMNYQTTIIYGLYSDHYNQPIQGVYALTNKLITYSNIIVIYTTYGSSNVDNPIELNMIPTLNLIDHLVYDGSSTIYSVIGQQKVMIRHDLSSIPALSEKKLSTQCKDNPRIFVNIAYDRLIIICDFQINFYYQSTQEFIGFMREPLKIYNYLDLEVVAQDDSDSNNVIDFLLITKDDSKILYSLKKKKFIFVLFIIGLDLYQFSPNKCTSLLSFPLIKPQIYSKSFVYDTVTKILDFEILGASSDLIFNYKETIDLKNMDIECTVTIQDDILPILEKKFWNIENSLDKIQKNLDTIQINVVHTNQAAYYYSDSFALSDKNVELIHRLSDTPINQVLKINQYTFANYTLENFQLYNFLLDFSNIQDVQVVVSSGIFNMRWINIQIQENCQFTQNTALHGGALYIKDTLDIELEEGLERINTIINSNFLNNNALGDGGAIYIDNSDLIFDIIDSLIQNNYALIGGGVRYLNYVPSFIQLISSSRRNLESYNYINVVIQDNSAQIFGNNLGSYARNMRVFSEISENNELIMQVPDSNDSAFLISSYNAGTITSGNKLKLNITFYDEEGYQIIFPNNYQSIGYPSDTVQFLDTFAVQMFSNESNIALEGDIYKSPSSFNQDINGFVIEDMVVHSIPGQSSQFYITSEAVLKIDDSQFRFGQYVIQIDMNFRKCKVGEILENSQGILFKCYECPQGKYSIKDPNKEENLYCITCPDSAVNCYASTIILKDGYWRKDNYTDKIEQCSNDMKSCLAQTIDNDKELYGDNVCDEGHIGPLCEECDVYGVFWNQRYKAEGDYECIRCEETFQTAYLIPLTLFLILIIIYIIFSIKVALRLSANISLGQYMRKCQWLSIGTSAVKDHSPFNIKQFMHYLQISQYANTYYYFLPAWLTLIPNLVSIPVEYVMSAFDCTVSTFDAIPVVYLRAVWSYIIPIIYVFVCIIIYGILILFKKIKHQSSYIFNGMTFLMLFLQPGEVKILIEVVSCRTIGGQKYITADLTYECYTPEHIKYIMYVILPGLLVWVIVIPGLIFRGLYKNAQKRKLDSVVVRFKYGFLYQEFKYKYYYWEYVRLYKRLFIVCIHSIYNAQVETKLVLSGLAILFYYICTWKMKPYQYPRLNNLDAWSMRFLLVLIYLNLVMEQNQIEVLKIIVVLFIIFINQGWIVRLFTLIVWHKLLHLYGPKISVFQIYLRKKFPFLKKYISVHIQQNMKVFDHWKIARRLGRDLAARRLNQLKNAQIEQSEQEELCQDLEKIQMQKEDDNLILYGSNHKENMIDDFLTLKGGEFSSTSRGLLSGNDSMSNANLLSGVKYLQQDRKNESNKFNNKIQNRKYSDKDQNIELNSDEGQIIDSVRDQCGSQIQQNQNSQNNSNIKIEILNNINDNNLKNIQNNENNISDNEIEVIQNYDEQHQQNCIIEQNQQSQAQSKKLDIQVKENEGVSLQQSNIQAIKKIKNPFKKKLKPKLRKVSDGVINTEYINNLNVE